MLIDGVLLGLVVALLRGGKLAHLADVRIRGAWVFVALCLGQVALYLFRDQMPSIFRMSPVWFLSAYLVMFLVLYQNRHIHGVNVMLIGGLLNFVVMVANGGYMPVSPEAASLISPTYIEPLPQGPYGKHILMSEETNLNFLGDIIPLLPPYPRHQVVSIGDVLINIGAFLVIQALLVRKRPSREEKLGMAM
ncbi:DUF5317 domain-containing protein [Calditerricola satsumensis]|uniref:DUF5317 domain-containing protein n=1 Tax=Calditerricola satsumensis TaxID=373054 RepID=A0A8J3BD93_9BACI|nr:DUF5317 domain-containing protein [Calditerricola satsumensis]GGK06365.1 hypothetical protein GCM10007043_20510 [Calditerricola satsumensis]